MIQGFLLDVDGTLVASNEAHVQSWKIALQHFGYNVSVDEIGTLIGMGGDKLLPTLVPGLTNKEGKGKEIADFRKKYFLEHFVPDLKPTPGARTLILELQKRNVKLVVATSSSARELQVLLQKAAVDDLLHEYVTASDVKASKPAPDVIMAALEKIALPPKEVVLLGDTPYDIAAAKKAGVATIALRSGGFSDEQLQGALALFDTPNEVMKNLTALLQL
jgi:HAD superfamily hydrolase (TIGR01509 family)